MDNVNLSFKCLKNAADLIARAAMKSGVGKSEFIRAAVIEKAEKVLTKTG